MGRKSAAVRRFWFDRVEILTTEYTETVEPYLKNTERSSVYSVWERSDLSVKFSGKFSRRKSAAESYSHFMKSECEGAAEFSTRSTRLIQNAERSSVYSVWERSDLSVYSVVKE